MKMWGKHGAVDMSQQFDAANTPVNNGSLNGDLKYQGRSYESLG